MGCRIQPRYFLSFPENSRGRYSYSSDCSLRPVLLVSVSRLIDIPIQGFSVSHKSISAAFRIEPFACKTALLREPEHVAQFLDALINDRPPDFAQSHVKVLCSHPSIPLRLTIQLLTTCSELESLTLGTTTRSPSSAHSRPARLPLPRSRVHLTHKLPEPRLTESSCLC